SSISSPISSTSTSLTSSSSSSSISSPISSSSSSTSSSSTVLSSNVTKSQSQQLNLFSTVRLPLAVDSPQVTLTSTLPELPFEVSKYENNDILSCSFNDGTRI